MLEEDLIGYLVTFMKSNECILHHDLSFLFPRLDDGVEVAQVAIHDDILRGIRIDEELTRYDIASSVLVREDNLSDNRDDDHSKLYAYLRLHIAGECVDETIKRLNHIIRMEG